MFKGLTALQHLNLSNNSLGDLGEGDCSTSRKSLEIIDLSYNQLNDKSIFRSLFFKCLGSKKLHLNRNFIKKINPTWEFFDKSLKLLDLRNNWIEILNVSLIFF